MQPNTIGFPQDPPPPNPVGPSPHSKPVNTPDTREDSKIPSATPPTINPEPADRVQTPSKSSQGKLGPKPRHPETVKETAKALYLQGVMFARVASDINVPIETVRKWATKGKWPTLKASLQARARQTAVVVVQDGLNDVSKRLRAELAKELADQVSVLRATPAKTVRDLQNTKERMGRAMTVRTIAETASMVFGWEDEQKISLIAPMVGLTLAAEPPANTPTGSVPIDAEVTSEQQNAQVPDSQPEQLKDSDIVRT